MVRRGAIFLRVYPLEFILYIYIMLAVIKRKRVKEKKRVDY